MRTHRQTGGRRPVKICPTQGREVLLAALLGALSMWSGFSQAQTTGGTKDPTSIHLQQIEGGVVSISRKGATSWVATQVEQELAPGDRLQTGAHTRAALLWSDQSVVPVDELTELEILPPRDVKDQFGLNLIKGIISFFHRSNEPGRIRIVTRAALAAVVGTEFVLEVDTAGPTERTILSVVDGTVQFSNDAGSQVLTNNEESFAAVGSPPSSPVGFIANNRLQWCVYYPGVLDLQDLPLTPVEETALADSLRAYRLGDLLGALRSYPTARQPGSDAERVYYAALQLAVGRVSQTQTILALLPVAGPDNRIQRLANALRQLIAAVKREPNPSSHVPELSTELIAASYYEQSLAVREESLEAALRLAKQAATNSPAFGFAWERVAELEFSFGRIDRAARAFEKSYALSPRNAEALALQGFLLAAENKVPDAIVWFDYALAADSSLGNAWLGRGLCRIRRNELLRGREDLLMAAALEPQRALLRSYLGKAYGEEGDYRRAIKELDRAKYLDPKDPTSWLYSALLKQQNNRINEAIRDLETSEELNENRSVYRSALKLDEDHAVRSANLAAIYRDAGMFDVSVQEAAKAVGYDYANYSAHLFLANSYNELRDPNSINLRYETPAEIEYLLANLLAPVAAGTLSPSISQQEYSKLFQRDGFGLISETEYLSRGAWTESGSQYGTFGDFTYSVDAFYHSDRGQRENNDLEQRLLSAEVKAQLTPLDTVYIKAIEYDASSGDLAQYFDPASANSDFRVHEKQEPILALGYHREWSPGVHTLFVAARLDDTLTLTNQAAPTLLAIAPDGRLTAVNGVPMHQWFSGNLQIYSAEAQQIWETDKHTTIAGGRLQFGDFRTTSLLTDPEISVNYFTSPAADQNVSDDFRRLSIYAYHYWQVARALQLIGGLSYDRITFPENFRSAPISDSEQTVAKVLPKAGLIWTPSRDTTLRFAYTRSLSGASLDQSFQLEPSQVAGFIQSYRSIIPESVSGPNAGAEFETFGISLEQKLPTRTYLSISGEMLKSKVRRTAGAFYYVPDPNVITFATPSGLREHLDYEEKSLVVTANQLISEGLSLCARYRLTHSTLADEFPDTQNLLFFDLFTPAQHTKSLLHQLDLFAIYNHPSGFFAEFEAIWYRQTNESDLTSLPGANFWQLNSFVGYRFHRRQVQLTLGLLNIADRDYRLNPLTPYNDLPRARTAVVRLLLSF